jgi:hypothetical protein
MGGDKRLSVVNLKLKQTWLCKCVCVSGLRGYFIQNRKGIDSVRPAADQVSRRVLRFDIPYLLININVVSRPANGPTIGPEQRH